MHHFITVPQIDGSTLIVDEARCVHQIGRVLRMQAGDQFVIQQCDQDKTTRWTVELLDYSKTAVTCKTIDCKEVVKSLLKTICLAMPNKPAKAELMVQKLSELGIGHIVFRPAERSQLRAISEKKLDRLQMISLEAVEQSHGWFLPEIAIRDDRPTGEQMIVFEQGDQNEKSRIKNGKLIGVVGPEGGFSPEELDYFKNQGATFVSLGSTVLRMETAAIVGGWMVQNAN